MIVNENEIDKHIFINVGRPDFYEEGDFLFWERFHNLIEATPISICVNGVYSEMKKFIKDRHCYGGGGFSYNFWFKSEDDKKSFIQEMNDQGFRM